jgi:DNA repair exonuclease SbcCD ATPase subunit
MYASSELFLCVGKKHHVGIEHASLGFGWPRLGSKLVLDPGLLVQEGVLMLTPKTCGFLGGSVKEFEEHQKHVDAVVQEPLYGRRGPPLKLDEYIKSLKEKIEQQQEEPEEQNRDAPAGSPAAVDPPPATGDIYIIPSESDDDWDIEALLEKKRTRNEVQVIDEEQQEQQQQQQQEEEQAPPAPVRADDTLASTLREMKRRREMRAKQQNTTV